MCHACLSTPNVSLLIPKRFILGTTHRCYNGYAGRAGRREATPPDPQRLQRELLLNDSQEAVEVCRSGGWDLALSPDGTRLVEVSDQMQVQGVAYSNYAEHVYVHWFLASAGIGLAACLPGPSTAMLSSYSLFGADGEPVSPCIAK